MASVVKRLARAQAETELVRLRRAGDPIEGYITGIGPQWVQVALLDPGIYLDGHVVLRLDGIEQVEKREISSDFVQRALKLHGEWPPGPAELELDGVRAVARSAAQLSSLITIHIELRDPDVCYIGVPVKYGRRYLHLLEVSPNAAWDERPTKWSWDDITRVDLGGCYERTLYEVAGPSPADSAR